MADFINNNALFELVYEEDRSIEGNIDSCKAFLQKKGFKLFHMNVRSIKNKLTELKVIMQQLNGKDFDCIIFSEAHLGINYTNVNLFDLDIGCYKIYNTLNNKRKTDGLVIYVKDSLDHSVQEINLRDCNCMRVNITKLDKIFTCHAFYRSPNGKIDDFLSELPGILNVNTNDSKHINILTGDFNIDILNLKNSKVQRYLNILAEKGYMSLINKPTHINVKSQTCLDHIFAGPRISENFYSFILNIGTSDHYPVILKIENTKTRNSEQEKDRFTTIKKIDYTKIIDTIGQEKWESIFSTQNPNICLEILTKKIKTAVDQNTTCKVVKIKKKIKPWITDGLTNSIKKRDKLHMLSRKQPFNTKLIETYKRYRNKLNSVLRFSRTEYLKKQVEKTKGDRRKIWGIINEEIKHKSKKDQKFNDIKIDGSLVNVNKNPEMVANFMNTYFSKIGTDTIHNTAQSHESITEENITSNMYMRNITVKEIEKIIKGLKEKSAPGWDEIDNTLIKKLGPLVSKPLCHIFNLCIRHGIFPNHFKKSMICPIYKKGNHQLVENYRPISLLPIFSKVLEKCVKIRLVKFLEENYILNPAQYGFREKKSTSEAILDIVESVYPILDSGERAAICAMDLSLAFNTVDHSILLRTMSRIGITGNCLSFFQSYLKDRSQCVKIRGLVDANILGDSFKTGEGITYRTFVSDSINNKPFSVPQGTVLSPVLYNIYVHELYKLSLTGKLVSFADDTALLVKGNSWQETTINMQIDLKKIKLWFQSHNLRLNVEKTKILPFAITKPQLPTFNKIYLHESPDCQDPCQCSAIDVVEQIKYLGVEMDCFLRWDAHIESLTKRLRRYIFP